MPHATRMTATATYPTAKGATWEKSSLGTLVGVKYSASDGFSPAKFGTHGRKSGLPGTGECMMPNEVHTAPSSTNAAALNSLRSMIVASVVDQRRLVTMKPFERMRRM